MQKVISSSTWCANADQAMKLRRETVLNFAEKCKNILAANWQGQLNTVKADANGSNGDIYTSTVKYILRKGEPHIWVPRNDLHNVNTATDERGSFSVTSPFPGRLEPLLRSTGKLPARVALTGDVVPYKDEQAASESLKEAIFSEQKALRESGYAVSSMLSSSDASCTSLGSNLKELLEEHTEYTIYKFYARSCVFVNFDGRPQKVELDDGTRASKSNELAPFSAQIIDSVNQSEARRRALILFCFTYLNAHIKEAYMLSIDRKRFNVLGKVVEEGGFGEDEWEEYRLSFEEDACDVESFCLQLLEMEEEAVKRVSGLSGLR